MLTTGKTMNFRKPYMRYRTIRPPSIVPRVGGCNRIPLICGYMGIETMNLREWSDMRVDRDYTIPSIGEAQ